MQCSRCQTSLPENTMYCYNCGANLSIPSPSSTNDVTAPSLPLATSSTAPETPTYQMFPPTPPTNNTLPMESGWAEFSGVSMAPSQTYPPVTPLADSYESMYQASSTPSVLPPPLTPVQKRRRASFPAILLLSILALALFFSGVFVGTRLGPAHNSTTQAQATAAANTTPDANQLYHQVTSQTPAFSDSLQNPTLSQWSVFENPTFGCDLKNDGLHVHIQDLGHFTYCTSGYGAFSDFAVQVDMNVLTGNGGGGLTLRGNTSAGNIYYFHVLPNGFYHFYLEQNHQLTTELVGGTASSFVAGQKNTLTAIAQGNLIYCYVNQKFLTMIRDSTYSSGFVGVSSDAGTTPSDVVYTNVKIWRL